MKNTCTCTSTKLVVATGFILGLSCTAMAQQRLSPKELMLEKMGQHRHVVPAPGGIAGGVCNTSTLSCFEAHPAGNPGCNQPDCCTQICAADAFCCSVNWDSLCAGAANNPANQPPCVPPPPADNNLCAGRLVVGEGSTPYNTTGATTDGPDHATCLFTGTPTSFNDLWFNYTATASDELTVSLCGSAGDTTLSIYNGCTCPQSEANLVACNDDFCGLQSQLTIATTAGQCYKIRVGTFSAGGTASGNLTITAGPAPCSPVCGKSATHGCFETGPPGCTDEECCCAVCAADAFCCNTFWDALCVGGAAAAGCTAPPPPANDLCENRIDVGLGATTFSTLGALTDGPAHELCGDGWPDLQVNQDIWFNFTPTEGGLHVFSLCSGTSYDSKMALYEGCTCPIVDDSTLLACDDDNCGPVGGPSQVAASLTAGTCYKVRVGGFGGASGSGTLTISSATPPPACAKSDHDCLTEGGPGCNQPECCGLVCALDPFCCETAWDALCVDSAAENCGCGACPSGGTPDCPTDLAPEGGDGQTNVDDLLILLQNWGPCQ